MTDTNKIHILNHGHVALVNHMGDDLSIVKAARVSYNSEPRSGRGKGSDFALLKYLLSNRHTSPFEHVTFTFEVKAPIFVFRQWHRHRTWSFNEVSARYTVLPDEFYIPELSQITTQHTDNKQMRTKEQHPAANVIKNVMFTACNNAFGHYEELIENGCPRELARSVLPVGIYSSMFATIDLHNLMHFLSLRDHDHAQHEIRVYAAAMRKLIEPIVPDTMEIYDLLNTV